MNVKAVHWNPPDAAYPSFVDLTRCGRRLQFVQHRADPADATCNTCRRLASRDGKL